MTTRLFFIRETAEALRDYTWGIRLMPLYDIHLNPAKPNEIEVKGNRQAVEWLSMMALVILLMGWFNYINLSTARAMVGRAARSCS